MGRLHISSMWTWCYVITVDLMQWLKRLCWLCLESGASHSWDAHIVCHAQPKCLQLNSSKHRETIFWHKQKWMSVPGAWDSATKTALPNRPHLNFNEYILLYNLDRLLNSSLKDCSSQNMMWRLLNHCWRNNWQLGYQIYFLIIHGSSNYDRTWRPHTWMEENGRDSSCAATDNRFMLRLRLKKLVRPAT